MWKPPEMLSTVTGSTSRQVVLIARSAGHLNRKWPWDCSSCCRSLALKSCKQVGRRGDPNRPSPPRTMHLRHYSSAWRGSLPAILRAQKRLLARVYEEVGGHGTLSHSFPFFEAPGWSSPEVTVNSDRFLGLFLHGRGGQWRPPPELTRDRAHSANSSISQYSLSSQTSSGSAGCAPAQSRHRSILWKDRDQVLEGEGARIVHPKNRDQQMPPSRSGTWHRFGGMWFCRLFPPMPIRRDVRNDIRVL